MNTETTHLTAQACLPLLQQINFEESTIIEPYLNRLFFALDNGDTFIYLKDEEKQSLKKLSTLLNQENAPLCLNGNRLSLTRQNDLEKKLANKIRAFSNELSFRQPEQVIQNLLNQWFSDEKSRDQKSAVAMALFHQFMLISGGPGTGKTTTVARLLALLCQDSDKLPEIQLLAPTGKAAMRMSQALQNSVKNHLDGISKDIKQHLEQLNAKTVHRLLGLKPPQMLPKYHAERPLNTDIIVLDEASMMDNYLFYQLLCALPKHCRLILLGDTNQLPAVGIGAILQSLSQSPMLPETANTAQKIKSLLNTKTLPETLYQQHAKLTISHRFDDKSGIGQLAQAVLAGNDQRAWQCFNVFPKQLTQQNTTPIQIAHQLYQQQQNYWQTITERQQNIDKTNIQKAFTQLAQTIVLTATQEDSETLNTAYQNVLKQKNVISSQQTWFTGQSIMITRNDHTQELYNGDIGIIVQQDNHYFACFQNDSGSTRQIPLNRLPEYQNAFAITVHKSQGSEYQHVWFIAPQDANLLNRALLYTAITRAKEHFVYFGTQNLFQAACHQNNTRKSALANFLFQAA